MMVSGAAPVMPDKRSMAMTYATGRGAAVLALAMLVGLGAAACKADEWPVNGDGAAAISDSIDLQVIGYLDGNRLPGATVAVTRGGRLVWSKGYGWAHRDDGIPMETWHRSRIGSVSKLLTTIGILQLVEDGELDLDTKVYGHPGETVSGGTWPTVAEPTALVDPEGYWEAILDGVVDFHGPVYVGDLFRTIDWASRVEVTHLLSHTSGLLRSGHIEQIEDFYGRDASELTYPDLHRAVLRAVIDEREDSAALACYLDGSLRVNSDDEQFTGARHRLPPFVFEPGSRSCYSNHGFGLLGHLIDERSGAGPANSYRAVIDRRVLHPLGVYDVVPNNSRIRDGQDAWPHGGTLDASSPSGLGLPTGGWSASARDMARVMCSLDRSSNHQRVLSGQSVQWMESIAYPSADPQQPLGWDWRSGHELYKNGSIGGGVAVAMKFLPGALAAAPNDEINVTFHVNSSASGDAMPPVALLRDIARKVAEADIPTDYDLFHPAHPCVVEEPTLEVTQPGDGHTVPLGTEIFFEAQARDWRDRPLSITWTLPGTGRRVTQPDQADGVHRLFHDGLPPGEHSIEAKTTDTSGNQASVTLRIVVTYEPPEVTVVSHVNGATVWAGDPLHLAGQGITGGHFPLSDDALTWQVRRGGTLVRHGSGPQLTVPATLMVPGAYTVILSGDDGTGQTSDTVTVTAVPRPVDLPRVFIRRPVADSVHIAPGGIVTVDMVGAAVDAHGQAISGVNFRWRSISAGQQTVLCAGTGFGGPPASGGGFVAPTSCASFSTTLTGQVIGGNTVHTIVLEARDTDGNVGEQRVTISVFTPPAG
jgi:CubicO group peptidase (beta-lactamase class C family)